MNAEALPCIICGKQLENVFKECNNQPEEGLYFRTQGAYGSTAFDPIDYSYLEINVCDDCIVKAQKQNRVYRGRRLLYADVEADFHLWTGPGEE